MNSRERKEKRYLRRKEKRLNKIIERSNRYASINEAFCFHKVMFYSDKCCNGVRWKKSTINFELHQFTIISTVCHNIKNNTYKVGNTYKFQINERGKVRNIDAPHIKDRLVHKVLSNEIILPIYQPHLIYDNGASQKNKGFTFSLFRLRKKLQRYFKKYGNNGYIVLIDYSKFFENSSHEVIHKIHEGYIRDSYTIQVIEDYTFIVKGIALGIEMAQKEASIIPNVLDHYVQNRCSAIVRYMDDSCFICKSYDEALKTLRNYCELSSKYGIIINTKKTKIVKLTNYFKFCKWNYKLLPSGKVIIVPDKRTIYRQRRKLRKMHKLYQNKDLLFEEIKVSKTCFMAYLKIGNSNKYLSYLNDRYKEVNNENICVN